MNTLLLLFLWLTIGLDSMMRSMEKASLDLAGGHLDTDLAGEHMDTATGCGLADFMLGLRAVPGGGEGVVIRVRWT